MSNRKVFTPPLFDKYNAHDDECDEQPTNVTCKFCGKKDLAWDQDNDGKWILYSLRDYEIHRCASRPKRDANLDIKKLLEGDA